jgi:hypothetical protein
VKVIIKTKKRYPKFGNFVKMKITNKNCLEKRQGAEANTKIIFMPAHSEIIFVITR